jgi:spore coat protein U-like protein
MHRIALILPALLATSVAAQAQAQTINPNDTGQGRLEIAGRAPPACVLNAPTASGAQTATFTRTGASSGEIRIVEFGDPQTAQPRGAAINLALPVICNAPHRLTVTSTNGGLLRDGGNARNRQSPTGFGEFVGYQISATWAGQNASVQTINNNVLAIATADGGAGDMDLTIAVPPGGGALVAGRYADTVTVLFEAAF